MAFGLGRNRSARVAAWLLPVVALGGLQLGLISAVESTSGPKASDRWYPTAVGTTWLYSSRSNGRDAGTHLAQVVGHGFTLDGPAAVVESRWDDLLGNGPARQVLYLEAGDDRLLIHGQRANGFYAPYDPPQPQWERSQSPGASFTWTGTFGIEEQRLTTTLEAREDLVVAGEDQPGCEHYRTVSTVTTDGGEVERTYDAWLCPEIGPVRTIERAPDVGVLLEEELVGFASPARRLGSVIPDVRSSPGSGPGETPAVDNERTGAVPDASVDLTRLAWSDGRKDQVKFPPVGRKDLVVLAEQDGTVSATRTSTGEVLWRVAVPGPVPVSPVVSGSYVIVAGTDKVLSALDALTGVPRWAVPLSDVPAVAPLVVDDTVVVAGQDRRVRALGLTDGRQRWETATGDVPGAPPALAGGLVVVADKAGGVAALRLSDGAVQWSTVLERRLTAGPAVAGDRVVMVDRAGIVSAFDAMSGDLDWSRYIELDVNLPVVVAGDLVLIVPGGDRMLALDRDDGTTRWRALLGGPTDVSPLVVGDSVLVMGRDSVLQRRSLADGSEVESVALTSPSPEAPVQAQLAPVWIGGQVVVTLDLQLPWPRTNLLAFGSAGAAEPAGAADGTDDAGDGPPGIRLTGELRSIPGLVSGRPRLSGSDLFIAGQDQTARVVPGDGPVRTLVTSPAQVTYAIPVGDVVLTTEDEDLVAVPAAGGEPRWRRAVGAPRQGTEPVVAGDTVVVPVFGAGLLAADLATGAPRWLYEQDGTVGTGSPVALPDGDIVYAVGGLVRLDGATGQPRWTVPGFTVYGPIAVGTGVVVLAGVTATGSFLGAFDLVTGQEVWRRPFPAPYLVGPAIGGDTVVAVDANGQAVALDAATGALRWTHAMRTGPGGTPVILGDRVVLAEAGREEDLVSRDTRLTVHDLRTGHYLGSIEPPGFALSRGAFGLTEGSIVTYTVGHGPAIMVLGLE